MCAVATDSILLGWQRRFDLRDEPAFPLLSSGVPLNLACLGIGRLIPRYWVLCHHAALIDRRDPGVPPLVELFVFFSPQHKLLPPICCSDLAHHRFVICALLLVIAGGRTSDAKAVRGNAGSDRSVPDADRIESWWPNQQRNPETTGGRRGVAKVAECRAISAVLVRDLGPV